MALVPTFLAEELNALTDLSGLNAEDIVKVKALNTRLAVAITNYLLTAQVVTVVNGGVCAPGGPIAGGVGSGSLK